MATDNRVRVVFEAVLNGFNTAVDRGLNQAENNFDKFKKRVKSALSDVFSFNTLKNVFWDTAVEAGKTQQKLNELASLGIQELDKMREAARDFSGSWSGTTRDEFLEASYAIKSGISSLTDEMVAGATTQAGVLAKATKATTDTMTNLFAQAHAIYRGYFNSDDDFFKGLSGGVAETIKLFRTSGTEMSSFISNLGANASSAGVELEEILAIGGKLQNTVKSGSEAATLYISFLNNAAKAEKRIGLELIDVNGRLKSTVGIIEELRKKYGDTIDATESLELQEAFGRLEAVKYIKLLYDGTLELAEAQSSVNAAIERGSYVSAEMAAKIDDSLIANIDKLKNKFSNLSDELGDRLSPRMNATFNTLFNVLDRMAQDGSLDRMAESIANLANMFLNFLINVLNKAPEFFEKVVASVRFLIDNLHNLIYVIGGLIIALGIVSTVVGALMPKFSGLPYIVKGALAIVAGSALMAGNYFNQWGKEVDGVTNSLIGLKNQLNDMPMSDNIQFGAPGVKEEADTPIPKVTTVKSSGGGGGVQKTYAESQIEAIDKRYKHSIGVLESRIEYAVKKSDMDTVNINTKSLEEVMRRKLSDLNNALAKASKQDDKDHLETERNKLLKELVEVNKSLKENMKEALNEIDDTFSTELDVIDSRLALAEKTKDRTAFETVGHNWIETLNEKLGQILSVSLEALTREQKNIWEAVANKLKLEILNATEKINGGLSDLIGEFNKPSKLGNLTKYQSEVLNNNSLTNRLAVNNDVVMYLTLENLDKRANEKMISQSKNVLRNYANDLSDFFMKDVMRGSSYGGLYWG